MSMEQCGGEVTAKHAKSSDDDAGEDRLSALPDDVLVLILLRLETEDAARTCVLSNRWRRLWTLLPELRFDAALDPHFLRDALSSGEVPLRRFLVGTLDASPQSLAAWLPAAARRVSGKLVLVNVDQKSTTAGEEAEASERGAVELPCFEKANAIGLELGFLGLSMPPAGVFARLTDLYLHSVRFHGPGELGDMVSSPRCPCLQKLAVCDVQGLDSITIDSESLQVLELNNLRGVRRITAVAPALENLNLLDCFLTDQNQPVADISASPLKLLKWMDTYDPYSVHLGSMEHIQKLAIFFSVYGQHGFTHNNACLLLLPRFKAIKDLSLTLYILPEMDNLQYMMEDMTVLPDVTFLHLIVTANRHAFGACSFHVLKICSGIKRLRLILSSQLDSEEQSVCSSGCICDQPTNWKTEELLLNHLQELEIKGFRASEHEVAFVNRLLNWATVLKTVTVTFHRLVNESKAQELFQMCQSFSRPDICMKIYKYQKFSKVLYAPED